MWTADTFNGSRMQPNTPSSRVLCLSQSVSSRVGVYIIVSVQNKILVIRELSLYYLTFTTFHYTEHVFPHTHPPRNTDPSALRSHELLLVIQNQEAGLYERGVTTQWDQVYIVTSIFPQGGSAVPDGRNKRVRSTTSLSALRQTVPNHGCTLRLQVDQHHVSFLSVCTLACFDLGSPQACGGYWIRMTPHEWELLFSLRKQASWKVTFLTALKRWMSLQVNECLIWLTPQSPKIWEGSLRC